MDNNVLKAKVRELITDNKLQQALDELLEFHQENLQKDKIVLLKSRLKALEKSEALDTIEPGLSRIERNKIRASILEIASNDQVIRKKRNELKEISPNDWSKTPLDSLWNKFKSIFEDKS